MDDTSELVFVFSSLPHPARHNILTQLTPEKAIGLCNSNSTNRKLCKEDYDVWIERINSECEEYKAVGERIDENNSYDKYVECKRERNKLSNLSRAQRIDLIKQGDLLNFIRSNPTKYINYFIVACSYGRLNIAKWFATTFQITEAEAKSNSNSAFLFSCEKGHLDVAKWLHATFVMTEQEAKIYNSVAFRWACRYGHLEVAKWLHSTFHITNNAFYEAFQDACVDEHYNVTRWLDKTFDLGLTPEQRNMYRRCL